MEDQTDAAWWLWGPFKDGKCTPGVETEFFYTSDKRLPVTIVFDGKPVPSKTFEVIYGQSWRVTLVAQDGVMTVTLDKFAPVRRDCSLQRDRSLFVFGTNPLLTGNEPVQAMCLTAFPQLLGRVTIEQVAASEGHVVMLSSAGQVFTIGSNDCGELGLGDFVSRGEMTNVPMGYRVSAIAARHRGSLFLDIQNTIRCAGIRLPGAEVAFSPVPIVPEGMEMVRVGSAAFVGDDVMALDAGRSCVVEFGTFGRSKKPYRARPSPNCPENVRLFAANLLSKLCISSTDVLYVGAEQKCVQDVPFRLDLVTNVCVSRCSAYFLLKTGQCYEYMLAANRSDPKRFVARNNLWTQLEFGEGKRAPIVEIAAGSNHAIFLDKDGKVYGLGAASEGQLGDNLAGAAVCFAERCGRPVPNCPKGFKICASQNFNCVIIGQRKTWVGLQMAALLANENDPCKDCTLFNDAGEEVRIHKIILAARSQIWRREYDKGRINCGAASLSTMKAAAELMYTDRMSNLDDPKEVFELARALALHPRLQRICMGDVDAGKEHLLEQDLADTVDQFKHLSDFSIEVDDGPPIATHKVLLSRNPYFQTLFSSSYAEAAAGKLRMQETSHNGMRLLLRFVASEKLDVMTPDDCVDVLLVCNKLLLPDLKQALEAEVLKHLEPENSAFLFNVAIISDCAELRKVAARVGAGRDEVDMDQILDDDVRELFVREMKSSC